MVTRFYYCFEEAEVHEASAKPMWTSQSSFLRMRRRSSSLDYIDRRRSVQDPGTVRRDLQALFLEGHNECEAKQEAFEKILPLFQKGYGWCLHG